MKKLTTIAAAIAALASIPAFAQMGGPDPYGEATVSKDDYVKGGLAQFDTLDTNKDGKISADEMAGLPGGGRGMARADANGDGAVSKQEQATSLNARFDMMDADKNGQLTKAERDDFRAQMMERMRAMNPGS